jgi:N-glycosylase/DNA lyase
LRLDVPFGLDATLCCGQVFRWEKRGEWWYGVVGERVLKVRQVGEELEFGNVDGKFIARYFSLDHDLPRIRREICKDGHIGAALREFWGLRIIRQEPWECLVSFICATYKNVAAIKRMLLRLSAKFGKKVTFDGLDFCVFPEPEKLANASIEGLAGCGLGYRARYVREASRMVCAGKLDLERLRTMQYHEAKRELCGFPGVGAKVADCVLLFSLGRLDAFPVDVWVKRAVLKYYAAHFPEVFVKRMLGRDGLSGSEYERLNAFGREYFGEYAGYAQEYLYHYERMRSLRGLTAKLKKV